MPAATTTNRARRAGAQVADVTAEGRSVASDAAGEAQQIASSAAERGGALVQQATEDARQLADTVKTRAGEVTGELLGSGRSLVEDARYQLRSEATGSAERVAGTFRGLGEEVQALAEGRPEEAPTITQYVWRAADGFYDAADRVYAVAEDFQERGFSGVLDDVQSFARRRPGAFLLGAAVIGFGVGRYVKAEAAERKEQQAAEEALTANAGRSQVGARTSRR
jgi:vacuolar-type H+-ATPase subunit H